MKIPDFTVQWHLITACGNSCRHCYIDKKRKSLPLEKMQAIVDDLKQTIAIWSCHLTVSFSGGDPLLYPHFFRLLNYLKKEIPNCDIRILGNPELLTHEIIEKLKDYDLFYYQISLDGGREVHDYFRYPGSFDESVKKLRLLMASRIKTAVMSTVSKDNINKIPDLVDLVAETGVNFYDFSRFIPVGRGVEMKNSSFILPEEFKQFLIETQERYKRHKDKQTFFGRKEPLWKLLQYEEGTFKPLKENKGLIWSGCNIGATSITILEDGAVLACRRLPIVIGYTPQQTIRDLFISSDRLDYLRGYDRIEKCKDCLLLLYCRGCRAVAFAGEGNYFAPDPQCWK